MALCAIASCERKGVCATRRGFDVTRDIYQIYFCFRYPRFRLWLKYARGGRAAVTDIYVYIYTDDRIYYYRIF